MGGNELGSQVFFQKQLYFFNLKNIKNGEGLKENDGGGEFNYNIL
jgi:hypothetical protein